MVSGIAPDWDPLLTRLSHFVPLSGDDTRALVALMHGEQHFHAQVDIVAEGDVPRSAFLMTEGMACRYRVLDDGRRQIIDFIIPGDICDLYGFLLAAMDHSIGTIVPSRIAAILRDRVIDIMTRHPRIAAALWWSALQDEAMQRERIVALGRRDARGRVAYLLCELAWRQIANGTSNGHAIRLPLTQLEIADALGLTPVHVNRVLQELRREGLITIERRRLALLNLENLQGIAGLNHAYLHLGGAPKEARLYLNRLERDQAASERGRKH